MLNDFDMLIEETSVDHILRRVRSKLLQRDEPLPEYAIDMFPESTFNNIDLGSDLFFYTDYAAKIYDPRTVPANTRLYKFKTVIMRLMRVYATRQVEFNAAMVRVMNLFLDKFQDVVKLFKYFREAEVRLQSRIEDAEERQADLNRILIKHRQRLEYLESMDSLLIDHRFRLENLEALEPLLVAHRGRLENLEKQEKRLNSQRNRLERVEEAERIVIQNHRVRIEDVEDREREFERRITKIEDLKEHLQIALSENVTLRQRVDSLLLELESGKYVASGNVLSAKSAGTPAQAPADTSPAKFLNDHLYFPIFNEDRGIEDVIHKRIKKYVPYFSSQKIDASIANPFIVDIGCGRGEFLEECIAAGIPCKGVDINEDMIAHCKNKKLDVVLNNALGYLSSLKNGSLRGLISCHVIEHLTPPTLLTFLRLCVQKLAPGGRIVLETPNPCSFFALSMFYRDFTHQQPVHPDMLKLALQKLGMKQVEISKLSPVPKELCLKSVDEPIMNKNITKLNDLMFGYLDYAALAEKPLV